MSGVRRAGAALAVAVAMTAYLVPVAAGPARADPLPNADWIKTTIVADFPGAGQPISQYPVPTGYHLGRVDPYLGNYAALGLAASGDASNVTAAYNHLLWYQDRTINDPYTYGNGYVSAYDWNGTAWLPTPWGSTHPWDATDSNAGTFLMAAKEWYLKKPAGAPPLSTLSTGIANAVQALHSTQDIHDSSCSDTCVMYQEGNGLVWNLPVVPPEDRTPTKYLMDNAEAYAGLRAGAYLQLKLGQTQASTTTGGYADALEAGLEDMWVPGVGGWGYYAVLRGSYGYNDTNGPMTWSHFYPDAFAQMLAVAIGNGLVNASDWLIPSARATTLVNKFTSASLYGSGVWRTPASTGGSAPVLFDIGGGDGWGHACYDQTQDHQPNSPCTHMVGFFGVLVGLAIKTVGQGGWRPGVTTIDSVGKASGRQWSWWSSQDANGVWQGPASYNVAISGQIMFVLCPTTC